MSEFGFFGAAFGQEGFVSTQATYAFGTPTGTSVGSTLTETITLGSKVKTVTYTETQAATATSPALFQISAPASGGEHEDTQGSSATLPTYSFVTGGGGTTNLIEMITTAQSTEVLTYTGGATLSDILTTFTTPSSASVTFSFASGTGGTTVTETFTHGSTSFSHAVPVNPTAQFSSSSGSTGAIETEKFADGNSVQTITYQASTGSNYVISSTETAFIAQGSATTPLDLHAEERAYIAISSSGTKVTPVSLTGTSLTSFTPGSSASFAVVAPTTVPSSLPAAGVFVEETVTFGSHSYEKLFYSATGASGLFTQVAEGTSIDVTGVAAQLAQLPASIIAVL